MLVVHFVTNVEAEVNPAIKAVFEDIREKRNAVIWWGVTMNYPVNYDNGLHLHCCLGVLDLLSKYMKKPHKL